MDEPAVNAATVTFLNTVDGPHRTIDEVAPPAVARSASSDVRGDKGADFRAAVVTREEWAADESLRFSVETGAEEWPASYVAPRIVVVHHTATRNRSEDPAADVRAIYAFHAVTQGWGDIGYHALIDHEGQIYEGRRGRDRDPTAVLRRDVLSHGVVAGHAFNYNYGSIGIALLGNFQDDAPTEPMWRALEELLTFEHRRSRIDPRTTLDFPRANNLWRYELPAMPGHRDCNNTECPGDFVYPRLPELRQRVAERVAGSAPPGGAIVAAPASRNFWLGTAQYTWAGRAPYDCIYEGFQKRPDEDAVDYRRGYDADAVPEHVVTSQTGASFALREPGQYTLHLQPMDQEFADRHTILAGRHIVRDNSDPEGVERVGLWTRSRSILEFNGVDYEFAEAGSGSHFTWTIPVPEAGRYSVQACWPSGPDRARSVPYTVAIDGMPLDQQTVDQSRNGDRWYELGTYDFLAEQACSVTLSTPDEEDFVAVADAIRLELVEGP